MFEFLKKLMRVDALDATAERLHRCECGHGTCSSETKECRERRYLLGQFARNHWHYARPALLAAVEAEKKSWNEIRSAELRAAYESGTPDGLAAAASAGYCGPADHSKAYNGGRL